MPSLVCPLISESLLVAMCDVRDGGVVGLPVLDKLDNKRQVSGTLEQKIARHLQTNILRYHFLLGLSGSG